MHYNRRNPVFIDDLAQTALFAGCTRRELRAVASCCTAVHVPAGRVLTRQGEPGYECFVVVAGQAVVERNGGIVAHVAEGSILGEIALLRGTTRTATVTALTDMQLLVFSRSELQAVQALGIATSALGKVEHIVDERLKGIDGPPPAAPQRVLIDR